MNSAQIEPIVNHLRATIQINTQTVDDGVTVAAFLLWGLLLEQERAGHGTAAQNFKNLAAMMPAEAARMGFILEPKKPLEAA